jgi:hypothetical protein
MIFISTTQLDYYNFYYKDFYEFFYKLSGRNFFKQFFFLIILLKNQFDENLYLSIIYKMINLWLICYLYIIDNFTNINFRISIHFCLSL